MSKAKLNRLERLHAQSEALVSSLVDKSQYADFGSDEAYRLNRMIDMASTRAERRYKAKMELITLMSKIPTAINLGYVTVGGVVRQCMSGPGYSLPADFKAWVNSSLNHLPESSDLRRH